MTDYETQCVVCGTGLTGRQTRVCAASRCRKAIQRPKAPLRDCKLCGQPFQPVGPGRRTVCPYNDADDFCQGLQDDRDDRQAALTASRASAECQAPTCTAPVPYSGRGRPRLYCSRSCRAAALKAAS